MLVSVQICAPAYTCKTHLANIIASKLAELGVQCVSSTTGDEFKNIDLSLSEQVVKNIVQKEGIQVWFEEIVSKKETYVETNST